MKSIFITVFILLFLLMAVSTYYKKEYFEDYCSQNNTCSSCANSSGCSWCPSAKRCLSSTSLRSTDKKCNQMNTISSAFLCNTRGMIDMNDMNDMNSHNQQHDFTLYNGQIADRVRPPNVYMNRDIEYSPETVMSNVTNMRNDLQLYQQQLPFIVASSVENNISPMVKGILSDNYYIQV